VTASRNGYIWGVNSHDAIFKCKKPCNGRWIHVPGHLKQIDGGQAYVYGVNKFDYIFARPVDGRGEWRHIPRKLKHVTGSGILKSEIFGVNKADDIFRCPKPCIGEWEHIPGISWRSVMLPLMLTLE
jgi:hypothetical protein